ncbi:MAG: hypothetical protein JNM94_17010 [Phycisphaerae bacterium]|nr:hypothetical protein [Phycisphaerae bacterium]
MPTLPCPLLWTACVTAAALTAPTRGDGYLGLVVEDVADVGCVVRWIDPGPLDGRGIESADLARPDLVVTIAGRPASAATLAAALAASAPGDRLTIEWRRARERTYLVPSPADRGKDLFEPDVRRLEVVVDDPARWRGTFGGPAAAPAFAPPAPQLLAPRGDGAFATGLRETGLVGELDALRASLHAVSRTQIDPCRLGHVTAALEDPTSIDALGAALAARCAGAAERPIPGLAAAAAYALDVPAPRAAPPATSSAVDALAATLEAARRAAERALGDCYGNVEFAMAATSSIRRMRDSLLVEGPHALETLAVIRRGAEVDLGGLVAALAALDLSALDLSTLAAATPTALDPALALAVEGDILACRDVPGVGWIVVGGAGPNAYDVSRVAGVIDLGGDDSYRLASLAVGVRAILDAGGNDEYVASATQGFGCGVCGAFVVVDRAGSDRYLGDAMHGAGIFGAGAIVDDAGDDTYRGGTWALGAAAWGVGAIADRGGNDEYRSDSFAQGCGGPRGFGVLLDAAGNDRYLARGTRPSEYGTKDAVSSFSQGLGVGIRRFASGGVGALVDLAGNDRYESGEFGQGGGYFFGLGVLADRAGNDEYDGVRYAQGFAAHQAAGVLLDDGGNDRYLGTMPALQGAAWDQSVAALIDRAGDDSYRGTDLTQGSAAQQAIAFLVDGSGNDSYEATHESAQGASGRNEYHYFAPPPVGGVLSFSLLLDLGDGNDRWSTGRQAGTTVRTGTLNATLPAQSTLHGLFLDAGSRRTSEREKRAE